ncbi:PREDICTED: sialic acid-binding Ig-like lectin 5-like [Elephantulus edwardii]|uniref:sialic acid-binding Ig-like lectin 5-like n=1 Tax=Elephantulus edwardii TaxID=28737 RepID=UPI0003F0AF2E|nr:PREDICTED: sialic acid-binding Ig-like lectin 5-like [Elephantulus edwardii]
MLSLLLLSLLCGESLQEKPGYNLQLPKVVTVQEGLCVIVPCRFYYPEESSFASDPLYIYWFRQGDSLRYDDLVFTNEPYREVNADTQGRFHLLGNLKSNNCSLGITDARKRDARTYLFRVERGWNVKYNYRDTKLNLWVTDLTQKPDIHTLEPLTSGRPTNLTCSLPGSCEEEKLLTFSWKGDALSALDSQVLKSSVLTFTPRPRDHGTNLTCRVKHRSSQVTTERTVGLNVSYTPQNLSVLIFLQNDTAFNVTANVSSLTILEGLSLRLVCVVDSNPPAVLSWSHGSLALNTSLNMNAVDLKLPQVRIENEGEFACRAQNPLGSQNISLNLSVLYPLQLLGPSCSWESKGLFCSCSAQAWPAASLHWWIGDELVEENSSNVSFSVISSSTGHSTNSSLRLSLNLISVLRLRCEAWNDHGKQNSTVLVLPGKTASRAEIILAGLGGAGAMALFSLFLCLTFLCIVKARRKQTSGTAEGMGDEDPIMGTVSWSCRQKPLPEEPPDHGTPSGDTPPLRGEQELHYASLSFQGMKPQESKDQGASSTTEYSEIKKSK